MEQPSEDEKRALRGSKFAPLQSSGTSITVSKKSKKNKKWRKKLKEEKQRKEELSVKVIDAQSREYCLKGNDCGVREVPAGFETLTREHDDNDDIYTRMIHVRANSFGLGVRVDPLPSLNDFPDFDARDYRSMPVDEFGQAYLDAYGRGWKKGGNVEFVGRQERIGLGYVSPEGTKNDNEQQHDPWHHLDLLLTELSCSNVLQQKKAAKEIRVLIKKMPSLREFFGVCSGAVTKLLNPLSGNVNTHPDLQEDLITTVLNISLHDSNKKLVAQNPEVVPLLIESLKFGGTLKTRSNSAAALFTLSELNSIKDIIVKAGALKPLVDLLDEGQPLAMKDAALAIFNLSIVHKNKGKAVSEGAIKVIMKKITDRILVDELLALLAMLSSHHKAIEEMGELGAVSCLLSIIKEDTSNHNKENCIAILYEVCYNDRTKLKEIWIDESTYGTISNLARSRTSKVKRKADGILKLLDRYVSRVRTT